jgi:hypothetical protein
LGEFTYRVKVVPKIIDWGLGGSEETPNALHQEASINAYGIFDVHNSLFDTIGLTKILFWHYENSNAINCRARSAEFHDIIISLKSLFQPLKDKFPALFAAENGVQQTKFEVDGVLQKTWPEEVRLSCPSFEAILTSLYKGTGHEDYRKPTLHYFFPSVSNKKWAK